MPLLFEGRSICVELGIGDVLVAKAIPTDHPGAVHLALIQTDTARVVGEATSEFDGMPVSEIGDSVQLRFYTTRDVDLLIQDLQQVRSLIDARATRAS